MDAQGQKSMDVDEAGVEPASTVTNQATSTRLSGLIRRTCRPATSYDSAKFQADGIRRLNVHLKDVFHSLFSEHLLSEYPQASVGAVSSPMCRRQPGRIRPQHS